MRGRWDSVLFFKHIFGALPSATSLFVEGSSVANEVREFLCSAAEPGGYLPMRQTLWPRSERFRVRFNPANLFALAELAKRHAEPEVLDHLFVYEGSAVLLEFPDAFVSGCPAYFAREVGDEELRSFAAVLGLEISSAS